MRPDQDRGAAQLGLLVPHGRRWYEVEYDSARVLVIADGPDDAMAKAEAELREMGYLPGGPPGLHESWLRMREFARRGAR